MISISKIIEFTNNEMDNTIKASKRVDYIVKTNEILRPYYIVK